MGFFLSSPIFNQQDSMDSDNIKAPLAAPHIAVLPTPGMGHLIPLAELAKSLVARHGFSVTFITLAISASKAQSAFLDTLPPSIASLSLPAVPLDDLPADAAIETVISVATDRSLPALRELLLDLKQSAKLVAFVADLFGADTFAVAAAIGVPPYLFHPSNFQMVSLMLSLPRLDAETQGQFRDLHEPVRLPGCIPIPGAELLHPLQDRTIEVYRWMVHHGEKYRDAEGIIVNTFEEIEPWASEFFYKKAGPEWPPIYPVGPVIQAEGSGVGLSGSECLAWLDGQPKGSVIFVSFGSAGTLSTEQTTELATGLEMSGQRFLWVVRKPNDGGSSARYFTSGVSEDPYGFLPKGFIDRIKGTGMLVSSWAPQVQVLGHSSTGGFLSHCGWNSTLESVSHGVPMITWPLFAEQRQNAVMLVEGVGVALSLEAGEDGVYKSEEIARVVKGLMEGEEGKVMRHRARELEAAAARTLAQGGASYEALNEVANKWKASAVA